VKWDILCNEGRNTDGDGDDYDDSYDDDYCRNILDKQNLFVLCYKHLSQNVSIK
jgi:hypothetical protein